MHVIAVGLLVVSGWSLPAQEIRQPILKDQPIPQAGQQQRAQDGQQKPATKEQDATDLLPAIKGIESALREQIAKEDKAESERKEKREVEDLVAQKDMARWAERMFWAAFASLVLTAIGVGLILWNLFYARDLARTSTEMAGHAALSTEAAIEAAHSTAASVRVAQQSSRAWLKLYPVKARVRFRDGKPHVSIQIQAKNIGASPAIDVIFEAVPYWGKGYMVGRGEVIKAVTTARLMADAEVVTQIILPEDDATVTFTAEAKTIVRPDLVIGGDGGAMSDKIATTIAATCSVLYKSVGSDEWRHTAHAIWITKNDRTQFDPTVAEVPYEGTRVRIMSGFSDIS